MKKPTIHRLIMTQPKGETGYEVLAQGKVKK